MVFAGKDESTERDRNEGRKRGARVGVGGMVVRGYGHGIFPYSRCGAPGDRHYAMALLFQ